MKTVLLLHHDEKANGVETEIDHFTAPFGTTQRVKQAHHLPLSACDAATTAQDRNGKSDESSLSYSGFVDERTYPSGSSRTELAASPSFEELAAQQSVTPIDDFETLLGKPSPEDESAEEFSARLHEWRQEGSPPATSQ